MREHFARWCVLLVSMVSAASCAAPGSPARAREDCEEAVRSLLLSPSSAQFSAVETHPRYRAIYTVEGVVDASNAYGAMLRKEFHCVVEGSDAEAFLEGDALRYYERVAQRVRIAKRVDPNLRPPDVVSYKQYGSVRKGMSVSEVNQMLGHEGVGGALKIEPILGPVRTYEWINYDGTRLEAKFKGGKLVDKQSLGLW